MYQDPKSVRESLERVLKCHLGQGSKPMYEYNTDLNLFEGHKELENWSNQVFDYGETLGGNSETFEDFLKQTHQMAIELINDWTTDPILNINWTQVHSHLLDMINNTKTQITQIEADKRKLLKSDPNNPWSVYNQHAKLQKKLICYENEFELASNRQLPVKNLLELALTNDLLCQY